MRGPSFDREYLVSQVAMMRINGKSTHFIVEFLMSQVKMGRTTAYEIIKEAHGEITELQQKELDDAYSEAIAQLEKEYEKTTDGRLRLSIRQELNKLQGLYKPNKVDITTNGRDIQISEVVVKIVNNNDE